MTKAKTTKRALLMSVLSMLLSVSMLVSSTFAWFTDSATSGGNRIIAGNLDVELYHSNAYVTKTEPVDEDTMLFLDKDGHGGTAEDGGPTFRWEPGAMVYENFTVENAGSLALKYKLTLNAKSNTVNGVSLADVLRVAVTDGMFDGTRASAMKLNYDMTVAEFVEDGAIATDALAAGAAKDCAVVIYWEPSGNDNDYNFNNGKTGELEISLGVDLIATQAASESDTFDNTYDVNANGKPEWGTISPVTMVVPVNSEGETMITTDLISISVPQGVAADDSLTLIIKPTDKPEGLTVQSNQASQSFDIRVEGLKEGNDVDLDVKLFVGKNLEGVKLYHYATLVDNAVYDAATGYISFKTKSFSPFTVVRNRIPGEVFTADELKEAVANGGKVVLGADINLDSAITISKDVTLDLNGKHIEFSEIQTAISVKAGATLTVNDRTNKGYIKSTGLASKSSYMINLDNGSEEARATLVLNGGQIIQNAQYNSSAAIYASTYSVVDINGGTVMVDSSEKSVYCVYIYSSKASVTIDDATLTNKSTSEKANTFYGSAGEAVINNCTINANATLINKDSRISNSTINGNLGTPDSVCNTVVTNCIINGNFQNNTYAMQYGKLVNCTVEGKVYSSIECISGGKFKNQFDQSWLVEGKILSTERDADGYYTLVDMPENWYAAKLTYEDTGETSYFRSPIEAYNKAYADSSTRGKATLTITKDCAIGKLFYPYNLNKIVVAEGVTVTLSVSVSVSASSTTERCTFENNGTVISSSSISGSTGKGYLINNGSMTVSYISAKTANWVNNGQIILTDGNSSISSSFTNNGTIKATDDSVRLSVSAGVTVSGTGTNWTEGSYQWSNANNCFVSDGSVRNATKGITYATLSDAVAGANDNDVLTIEKDIAYSPTATVTKTLTIDLNGHTVSYGNSVDSGALVVADGGNLTVKDSKATAQPTLNADGTVNYTSGKVIAAYTACGVMVKSGGTFTLESGTIQANSDNEAIAIADSHSYLKGADNAVVNIKGGLVINTNTIPDKVGDAIVIYGKSDASGTNGHYAASDPTLNISGGMVYAGYGTAVMGQGTLNNTKINISGGRVYSVHYSAIFHPQYGQMTISGDAIVTGVSAVLLKGGELTVSGGTLEATGKELNVPTSAPGSGSYITGDALYIEDNYNRGIVVTITGGTFKTVAPGAQEYRVLFSGKTPAVLNDNR